MWWYFPQLLEHKGNNFSSSPASVQVWAKGKNYEKKNSFHLRNIAQDDSRPSPSDSLNTPKAFVFPTHTLAGSSMLLFIDGLQFFFFFSSRFMIHLDFHRKVFLFSLSSSFFHFEWCFLTPAQCKTKHQVGLSTSPLWNSFEAELAANFTRLMSCATIGRVSSADVLVPRGVATQHKSRAREFSIALGLANARHTQPVSVFNQYSFELDAWWESWLSTKRSKKRIFFVARRFESENIFSEFIYVRESLPRSEEKFNSNRDHKSCWWSSDRQVVSRLWAGLCDKKKRKTNEKEKEKKRFISPRSRRTACGLNHKKEKVLSASLALWTDRKIASGDYRFSFREPTETRNSSARGSSINLRVRAGRAIRWN